MKILHNKIQYFSFIPWMFERYMIYDQDEEYTLWYDEDYTPP